jgi:hypothetical protein
VNLQYCHPFWSKCYVYIAPRERKSKVGSARAYMARFVGYDFSRTLEPTFKVIQVHPNGTYGVVRNSKDVIFDDNIDFKSVNFIPPSDLEFEKLCIGTEPPLDIAVNTPPHVPPLVPVHPAVEELVPDPPAAADALPVHPAVQEIAPVIPAGVDNKKKKDFKMPGTVTPAVRQPSQDMPAVPPLLTRVTFDTPMPPCPRHKTAPLIDVDTVGFNTPVTSPENDDAVYWYSTRVKNHEHMLSVVETSHYQTLFDSGEATVPKSFWKAMAIPEWAKSIDTELSKFEDNRCLEIVPYIDQHLVPMMWLFSVKNDGTRKARLVGRGDMMLPGIDFDPDAVYCGNISACSIKIVLAIAAKYGLTIRGGDLIGAYLITRANEGFPVFIKTPQGYYCPPGFCIQAVGNLYGFPPAGQNFSKEFDKCLIECGYANTPWDLKLFYKWLPSGIPMLIMAHSDDFRWFGPPTHIHEWDTVVATFNKHGYQVTDATDKEFVGIRISHDKDFNYYMDQHRMIDSIIKDNNFCGARDEHMPYPSPDKEPPLTKQDNASSPEEVQRSLKLNYRRIVGQLMYGMVHTMVPIMYALNVLSRYGNNPGDRHCLFLKHLMRYVKYAKLDRLKFHCHKGPKDIETMTNLLQLHFQCDADLGGNLDNHHSQTSYLGYLGNDLICWCSTDQGSISTSTAESEIKAVNHTLKSEVISNRGILNTIGWKQAPTRIEEDNQAAVFHSKATHMTRNLRHLDLCQNWIKEKVADGTCFLQKVASQDNNSDIGTKRVTPSIFQKLTSQIVDREKRLNI